VERAEAQAIYGQGREVVVAVLVLMDEQIRRLGERVARQDERIAELERRLGRSSRNSSTPPSQDPPGTRERKRADPSSRFVNACDLRAFFVSPVGKCVCIGVDPLGTRRQGPPSGRSQRHSLQAFR